MYGSYGAVPRPATNSAAQRSKMRWAPLVVGFFAIVLALFAAAYVITRPHDASLAVSPDTADPFSRQRGDQTFLMMLRTSGSDQIAAMSDEQLLAIGHTFCAALASSTGDEVLTSTQQSTGLPFTDIIILSSSAVPILCPENAPVASPINLMPRR